MTIIYVPICEEDEKRCRNDIYKKIYEPIFLSCPCCTPISMDMLPQSKVKANR